MARQLKPTCVLYQCEMRVVMNDTRLLLEASFGSVGEIAASMGARR